MLLICTLDLPWKLPLRFAPLLSEYEQPVSRWSAGNSVLAVGYSILVHEWLKVAAFWTVPNAANLSSSATGIEHPTPNIQQPERSGDRRILDIRIATKSCWNRLK
jgi:hypothetical protein